jgi:hypothetical protein
MFCHAGGGPVAILNPTPLMLEAAKRDPKLGTHSVINQGFWGVFGTRFIGLLHGSPDN